MGRSMRGLHAVGEAHCSLPCEPSVGLFSYRKRFVCPRIKVRLAHQTVTSACMHAVLSLRVLSY